MSPAVDFRSVLAQRWNSSRSGPFFEMKVPSLIFLQKLPQDYLAVVNEFGGNEGFLGDEYLRLYRLEELAALNIAYDVTSLLPELIVFGSNGCGEAFAFHFGEPSVIRVPFVPFVAEYANQRSPTFTEFIRSLASSGHSQKSNPATIGLEVHEKHPICLGGDPNNPENKVLVPVAKHAELSTYWNKVYRQIRGQQVS